MVHESSADMIADGTPLRWEGSLLVYTGKVPADLDINRLIASVREERMRQILGLQEMSETRSAPVEE